jgi:hypothetical protein
MPADQRHERDRREDLLVVVGVAGSGDLDQSLKLAVVPRIERHDETAADGQLRLERRRHLGSCGCDENRIERRGLRPTDGAVARADLDVPVAERIEAFARKPREAVMPLDSVNAPRNQSEYCRGVARAGTDFENVIVLGDLGRFDHRGDDEGL